jgi:YebC/PmpR family DNA-binding regulatory protein
MSGHSRWATIKRKKGAIDAKRGAMFTKAAKEVTMAAREGGGNADMNARLRAAVLAAKAINVPNTNIERAIKRGTGEIEGAAYEEIVYEGYGPGGVAMYVEVVTDNRNRTFPELRKIFEKCSGTIGSSGSVAYLFEKKGQIELERSVVEEDRLMEIALEAGADDISDEGETWLVTTSPATYHAVLKAIEQAGLKTASNELAMVATTTTKVEGKAAEQVIRLVESLEDHDDVQNVWSNFEMDDATLDAASGA